MTTTRKILTLDEHHVPGKRLGRHVVHDPRSWAYPAAMASEIRSVVHERHVPVFDQGKIGSCTGNAGAGCMSTGVFTHRLTEADAIKLYSDATHRDDVLGVFPPTDSGSSGLAIMRVLLARGWIPGYGHTFSLKSLLRALTLGPGVLGITWRVGCDEPDEAGVVRYQGAVRGGHEVELATIDLARKLVGMWNSWGPDYGLGGMFYMTFDDLELALEDQGDARFPRPPAI